MRFTNLFRSPGPLVGLYCWTALSCLSLVWGQSEHLALPTPFETGTLQVVPERSPRPLEGPEAAERFQLTPPTSPTAELFEPVRGNDAAIQLVVEQSRILTVKSAIAQENGSALVAVGDPTIVDFNILPNPRMIRLIGLRAGVTDVSVITTEGESYSFQVQVGWDLDLLRAHLRQAFPDAQLDFQQLREHIVVSGQARSPQQVSLILQAIQAHLLSVQPRRQVQQRQGGRPQIPQNAQGAEQPSEAEEQAEEEADEDAGIALGEEGDRPSTQIQFAAAQIINLIRVPGVQQVMLQVQIAELNRTALREIGADVLGVDPSSGNIFGTQVAGATVDSLSEVGLGGLSGAAAAANGGATSAFGIFPSGDFSLMIRALRENSVLSLLAEPNLMTMHGHRASFLAGGQFPVPVPQVSGGTANSITVQFKDFGVRLDFTPYVLENDTIRLHVEPEVSSIDFAIGTTLIAGGDPIPGLNTRRAQATVELKPGQTLAMAGLLQVTLDGRTARIPGLGDLPYIGPMFSNTSHQRVEKELLVMVTPQLVAPMNPDQVGPLPGSEITDPNDKEFYFLNRIEGRTNQAHRATTAWDNPLNFVEILHLEQSYSCGPVGLSQ